MNTGVKELVSRNKFQWLLIVILFLYWIPIIRFGFDPHHDGLIVATVNNLELSSSRTPFNQYGPAWFLFLEIFSKIISPDYFFVALRLATFLFYFLAMVSTFLLARKFLSLRNSLNVVVLLLGIQPFVTDFNSDMIPWPSALVMFLIPFVGFLVLDGGSENNSTRRHFKLILSGVSMVLVILTRVQIGIALVVLIFILFALYGKWRDLRTVATGFLIFGLATTGYFIRMGWFQDLVTDVFGFGSGYVFGNRDTFPRPTWTVTLTVLFILVFALAQKISPQEIPKWVHSTLLFMVVVSLLAANYVLAKRGLSLVQVLTVASRRVWISIILATAIYSVGVFLYRWISLRKLPDFDFALLVLVSLVAELQVWPLFDQMHAWWSATPCVILTILFIRSHGFIPKMKLSQIKLVEVVALGAVFVISLTTFFASVSHSRIPLRLPGFSGILISKSEAAELVGVQKFLDSKISERDLVLNLCTNANVFFNPKNGPTSASRAFLFWTPMFDSESLRADLFNAKPTKIVTCSQVTNPIFYPSYLEKQNQILNSYRSRMTNPSIYDSPNGVEWKVYSRQNLG